MVWIETQAVASVTVRAELSDVMALLADVPTMGSYAPGVVSIEEVGPREYRWKMLERKGVGASFTPDYVCKYRDGGPQEICFETISGNVKNRGAWRVSSAGNGKLRLSIEVTTGLDAPVPRLMKKPAELFARREAQSNLERQLAGIKARLER